MFEYPSKVRVLLVEDDADDRVRIETLFREIRGTKFECATVGTFEQAIAAARRNYDVFLIDYRLGSRDGLELIEALTSMGITAPIIVLTGVDDREVDMRAMKLGAADYLTKLDLSAHLLERSIRYSLERQRLASQVICQDRLATAGLMASSLAHEVGTPLGVIRGRAEYLAMRLDKEGVEGARKDLEIIVKQIDRVSGLIGSLLQFADGRSSNRVVPVNLALTLDNVIELFRVDFQKQGINLVCDVPREALVLAEIDGLQQVFINLVINAMHAMESHASVVKHRISFVCHEGASVWVVVVGDTGCGIPKKYLSEIFKPFFTTKEVGKGTGLGLPTTYQFVQSWGGTIGVESKEGNGTAFTLVLRKARL